MPYSPPTREDLRTAILRDLRTSADQTFVDLEIDDLINWGIVEVNRVYPLQQIEMVTPELDGEDRLVRSYTVGTRDIHRVEVWRDGTFRIKLEGMDGEPDSGWDLWGQTFVIPSYITLDTDEDTLKLYGYTDRDPLDADDSVAEFDAEAERGVRLFAVAMGYQRLQNDRALYQQWIARPGNNDISPTQLNQYATTSLGMWDRFRNQMRLVRR